MCFSAKHFWIRKTNGPMGYSGRPSSCTAAADHGPLVDSWIIRMKLMSLHSFTISLWTASRWRGVNPATCLRASSMWSAIDIGGPSLLRPRLPYERFGPRSPYSEAPGPF